jgi:hypothetical protein
MAKENLTTLCVGGRMFPTKKRSWIDDRVPSFPYSSWKEWTDIRPYDFLWKDYRPVFWNLRELGGQYEVQIFYLIPNGTLDFVVATIRVSSEDEPHMKTWMEKYTLA